MEYIDIVEATRRLGKSDRQVRRMIHAGTIRIKPPTSGNSKLELLASDVDKLSSQTVIARQQERLDKVEQQSEALRQRLDILGSQIDTLSMQLDTLSSAFRAFADDMTSRLAARAERLPQPTPKIVRPAPAPYESSGTTTEAPVAGEVLPDQWRAIVDLIKEHHAPETSVMRRMRPYLKAGSWKTRDGRTVKYAVDPEGHVEFLRLYGSHQGS